MKYNNNTKSTKTTVTKESKKVTTPTAPRKTSATSVPTRFEKLNPKQKEQALTKYSQLPNKTTQTYYVSQSGDVERKSIGKKTTTSMGKTKVKKMVMPKAKKTGMGKNIKK